jgi:uncharacterized lipoprotein YmbA
MGTQDWSLNKVTVPALLDRPQMVMKSGANGVTLLEYDRWAEPLDSMIARVLTDDLIARRGSNTSLPAEAEKRITVAIDEFDADSQGHVWLTALWTVEADDNKPPCHKQPSIACHSREGGNPGQDPRLRGGDNFFSRQVNGNSIQNITKTSYLFQQSGTASSSDISAIVMSMSGLLGKLADAIAGQLQE